MLLFGRVRGRGAPSGDGGRGVVGRLRADRGIRCDRLAVRNGRRGTRRGVDSRCVILQGGSDGAGRSACARFWGVERSPAREPSRRVSSAQVPIRARWVPREFPQSVPRTSPESGRLRRPARDASASAPGVDPRADPRAGEAWSVGGQASWVPAVARSWPACGTDWWNRKQRFRLPYALSSCPFGLRDWTPVRLGCRGARGSMFQESES